MNNDSSRLRGVLVNLISSAIKFTDFGSVQVKVHELNPDYLAIVVQDTGIGIASENLAHILRNFGRLIKRLRGGFQGPV